MSKKRAPRHEFFVRIDKNGRELQPRTDDLTKVKDHDGLVWMLHDLLMQFTDGTSGESAIPSEAIRAVRSELIGLMTPEHGTWLTKMQESEVAIRRRFDSTTIR